VTPFARKGGVMPPTTPATASRLVADHGNRRHRISKPGSVEARKIN
jgi:hypothetical protein